MNPARPLAHVERVAWLRLARTPGLGPLTFARLIGRFGDARAALEALPRLGRLTPLAAAVAEAELDGCDRIGARLIAACEPAFPHLLAALDPPPPVVSIRGDLSVLDRPTVALVGARDASAAGLAMAGALARDIGAAGATIVSGLARGVDAEVHRASLATGTVAVLAGGVDQPYPPQNLALYDAIAARGLIVSEMPLGHRARAKDFPRRNHLISGLSLAVVVVEAAERSGSLITARAAAEQGREVMAVPGSPLDPRARGANALLKEGAVLVESANDVFAALGAAPRGPRPPRATPLLEPAAPSDRSLAGRLAALVSPTPVHLNVLARLLQAPIGAVAAALTELEIEGRATSLPGGYAASSPPSGE
ncbi:MAG: DNA-processing protein DprA [Caulobacterales bacterium]